MKYSDNNVAWKKGAVFKADPKLAMREVEAVNKAHNGAAPDGALVEQSRCENTVLHDEFEWDDAIAAHKQRVQTEKDIKRSLVYVCTKDALVDDVPKTVRVFTNVKTTNDEGKVVRSYLNTIDAMKDPEYREQILEQAKRELDQFITKYESLNELADVLNPIKDYLRPG
jgi:hypothetical protein